MFKARSGGVRDTHTGVTLEFFDEGEPGDLWASRVRVTVNGRSSMIRFDGLGYPLTVTPSRVEYDTGMR